MDRQWDRDNEIVREYYKFTLLGRKLGISAPQELSRRLSVHVTWFAGFLASLMLLRHVLPKPLVLA